MSQKAIAGFLLLVLMLVVLALLLSLFAFGNGCCSPDSAAGAGEQSNMLFHVAAALLGVALILDLIVWIGALSVTAKQQQWAWFILILFFNWLAMLIYLKMEDDTPVPQSFQQGPANTLHDPPE